MARPLGSPNKDKPFVDALRMEIREAGESHKRLRLIARRLLDKAEEGDLQAIQQVADRLDGKPAQESTVTVHRVTRELTDDELSDIAVGGGEGTDTSPLDPAQLN